MNLLEDSEEYSRLPRAMDYLRIKYGQDTVKRALGMGSKGIGRINPFNGELPMIPARRRA